MGAHAPGLIRSRRLRTTRPLMKLPRMPLLRLAATMPVTRTIMSSLPPGGVKPSLKLSI